MLDTSNTASPAPESPDRPDRSQRSKAGLVVAGLAVLGLFVYLVAAQMRPHVYSGTVLQSPTQAPELGLTAHTGEQVFIDDFAGEALLIYFGYTQCPDLCPLTLSAAARAKASMGDLGEKVNVMMVTVDPERDTLEVLGDYVTKFDLEFLGVSGDPEDLAAVTSLYGVWADSESARWDTGYLVDHTSTLMAVGPDGHLRIVYGPQVTDEQLATDMAALLGA
jgi:protein SCO1/2